MKLIRGYKLIDIKEYEYSTGNSVLKIFNNISISGLITLVSLGNNSCEEEMASQLLDKYLEEHNIEQAFRECRTELLGENSENDKEYGEGQSIDITSYETLTDIYMKFCMQLMSIGLSYNEFWSMTTREMYRVFNSIVIKMQNETNRELSNYHTLAAMIGGAVWGKLQKDPPKVNLVQNEQINGDVDDMDVEDAIMVAKLNRIVDIQNRKVGK